MAVYGKYKSGKMVKVLDRVPKGYRKTQGATSAPVGAAWYNNGESRFSGKRKSVLVKVK
jgi:hypothetical protein